MEILHYFDPVDIKLLKDCDFFNKSVIGTDIQIYTESNTIKSLENIEIAIIGIPEDRNSLNKKCAESPDIIRKYFYTLTKFIKSSIVDFGNIKPGNTANDTYFAIRDVSIELIKNNIVPVFIGGSHDLTYATFLAYEKLEQTINIVSVDSRFDLGNINDPISSGNFLSKIISSKSNCLFNFTNIGYQTYYVSPDEIDLMKNILFDYCRLGFVQANPREIEPYFRDASLVSFDISAIRKSDAPAHSYSSPNGFYGEEACLLARYAGLSDKVSSFGIYEVNPSFDNNNQTAHLSAQIIWHFIEAFYLRKGEYPFSNLKNYKKIIVQIDESGDDIIFYNNPITDRWWMEVPYQKANYDKSMIVSCSYEDYEKAGNQEIPDRWWQTFQKIC